MKKITRKEAKEQGLKKYYNGIPCPKGHDAIRLVSNYTCIECLRNQASLWATENPEKVKKSRKTWVVKNPDKNKQAKQNWQKNNKGKVRAHARKRQTLKNKRVPNWVSEDDLFLIEEAYCLAALRTQITGIMWHVDHTVPLQGKNVSGFHCIENLQVIPGKLNSSKYNKWDWATQK
jgi:hypothetical protein